MSCFREPSARLPTVFAQQVLSRTNTLISSTRPKEVATHNHVHICSVHSLTLIQRYNHLHVVYNLRSPCAHLAADTSGFALLPTAPAERIQQENASEPCVHPRRAHMLRDQLSLSLRHRLHHLAMSSVLLHIAHRSATSATLAKATSPQPAPPSHRTKLAHMHDVTCHPGHIPHRRTLGQLHLRLSVMHTDISCRLEGFWVGKFSSLQALCLQTLSLYAYIEHSRSAFCIIDL